jgi:hypothetical protein
MCPSTSQDDREQHCIIPISDKLSKEFCSCSFSMALQVSTKVEVHSWIGKFSCATGDQTLMLTAAMEDIGLLDLQLHLENSGKSMSLRDYPAMPIPVSQPSRDRGGGGGEGGIGNAADREVSQHH